MYLELQQQLIAHVRNLLKRQYDLDLPRIVVDQPPDIRLGEYALPLSFELAKKLRKPPRKIAEEIVAGLGQVPGFEKFEVAGAGYINAKLNRAEAAKLVLREKPDNQASGGKILVEHTSINPNKAAHIGHLRNAILGDTFVRLLRASGAHVDIQNYIDNTGVQVADVVVGFIHLEKKGKAEIEKLVHDPARPFDYYCWDLYARVSQWYEEDKEHTKLRLQTLHEIEQGGNEAAAIGELVSTAVLRRHLETMQRLGIQYDFLPRESEILHLHFWDLAFEQMKQKGVLYFETEGKNKGCWVMRRAGTKPAEQQEGPDEDAKVIVRSNGTVTYVGKDIAYHLWKFGLLGRDFGYRHFYQYPDGHQVWISAESGQPEHPHFGGVNAIYNVIDSRQSDPQNNVIEAIRGLGYEKQAENYHHFSYEMVALTPGCAIELGYDVQEEDRKRAYIEVSGRKGFGVKADDLLDALISAAQKEVDSRHPERSEPERRQIATQIAIGALRYFMLKFTKTSVIAFDFKEALSFEGETGPYVQYAIVRATNIFRKAGLDPDQFLSGCAKFSWSAAAPGGKESSQVEKNLSEKTLTENHLTENNLSENNSGASAPKVEERAFMPVSQEKKEGALAPVDFRYLNEDDEIWQIWLTAGQLSTIIQQSIATLEPAYIAKFAFQLAQQFNNFYHKHHILTETDEIRKQFLLATAAVVRRVLIQSLSLMGIASPAVM